MRSWVRDHPLAFALIGVLLAIASTTVLDAVGFGINVLLLVPLFFACWWVQGLSRVEVGIVWGRFRDYVPAVAYPLVVLALVGLIAGLSGAASFEKVSWGATLLNLFFQILTTAIFAIVTEEGIFRGWLWAALERGGVSRIGVLVWTSVAFGLWHLSTALLPTPFHPALVQVPIYIGNAMIIGFNWARMRESSGSIVVTSVSHGVWNGLAYVLFGYGTTAGIFGLHNTVVFGPEIGLVGLGLNLAAAVALVVLVRPSPRPGARTSSLAAPASPPRGSSSAGR